MEIKGNVLEKEKYSASNFLKFLIPSLIGLILFIIPLPYGNIFNIEGISPVSTSNTECSSSSSSSISWIYRYVYTISYGKWRWICRNN